MSDNTLNSCGCCGVEAPDVGPRNPPGLDALAYRLDTHAGFKAALLAAVSREPGLAGLTTRADDDPAIALLDGWAGVLDVLAFYNERIANEGFLRTATELRSLTELGRAIGYEARPGVAASAWLAFTLDDPKLPDDGVPKAPPAATIPVGTRAQAIPGQDEKPQTFEVTEELAARAEWNRLRPRLGRERIPRSGHRQVLLAGTATNLKAGDPLLFVGPTRAGDAAGTDWDLRFVAEVATELVDQPERAFTRVKLDRALNSVPASGAAPLVIALRARAALFGHNAQETALLPAETLTQLGIAAGDPWPGYNLRHLPGGSTQTRLHLDTVYAKAAVDGWIALRDRSRAAAFKIEEVIERSLTEFGLSAKSTRLTTDALIPRRFHSRLRETSVYLDSEILALAEEPNEDPVTGSQIVLEEIVTAPPAGHRLIVSGTPEDGGEAIAEFAEVLTATTDATGRVTLTLKAALANSYARDSVTVFGNVAKATHGETKNEVLGAGDASRAFQQFELKQKPLTFTAAANETGAATTLEVRVNDVLWSEAPSLFGLGPRDRSYVVRRADDGKVTVLFGDGVTGARLPTGQENVRATYRAGIGLEGMARAGQISLLLDRPLGVREVVNPVAAEGAGDPEAVDSVRANAPFTVLTLGRVVSLRDFEDFARGFGGVGQAQAAWVWTGSRRVVLLSVLGEDGAALTEAGTLGTLRAALGAAREPHLPVTILSGTATSFSVTARVLVRAEYERDLVLADVEIALAAEFGFAKRGFAQSVEAGAVIAAIQRVEGVEAVDLDTLSAGGLTVASPERLPARPAGYDAADGVAYAAELLMIDPLGIHLSDLPR